MSKAPMRIGRPGGGHGKHLTFYDWGATPFFALQAEPRVCYCLYVPRDYDEDGKLSYPLIVLMHGTERGAGPYRDHFAGFAEAHDAIILAPMFPSNLAGLGDNENYKLLEAGGIRFDLALLAMVEEISARYRIAGTRFMLHGFSGGGHFAHRFLFLHPERLAAVSIGAPGIVTLFDDGRDWYVGIGDMDGRFGKAIDRDAVARVPVQCIVGGDDRETWEITVPEDDPFWRPGINDSGADRRERLRSLAASLERVGAHVRFDEVPGVGHHGWDPSLLARVEDFFLAHLTHMRGGAP